MADEMMQVRDAATGLVVSFPKGTPPEKINEVMRAATGMSAAKPTSSVMSDVALRIGMGQGLAMGYGDEIEGYVRSKLPGGRSYDEEVADVRKKIQTAERERPVASTTAEIGGSLLPAAGAIASMALSGGASAPAATAATARTATLLGNMARGLGRGAAVGGAQGAIEGFGKAEGGVLDRAPRALAGGALGAGVGGTIGAVAPVIGAGLRAKFASPAERAERQMLDVLGEQGATPQSVAQDYVARQAGGVKPEIIADMYPGSRIVSESRRVLNTPGANRAEIVGRLVDRADDQGKRLTGDFQQAVGTNRQFFSTLDELEEARRAGSKGLYEAANKMPARTPDMDDLVAGLPDRVFNEAKNAADWDRLIFPKLVERNTAGEKKIVGDYTIRDVDLIKRGLDRIIENNTDAVTGKANSEARSAYLAKQELTRLADDVSPLYAQARSAYAGPSAVMNAMNAGQRIFNDRPEISARRIAKMGESEKEGFLIGALDAVSQRIGRKIEGHDTTGAFRSGNAKQQIEAALTASGRQPEEVRKLTAALFGNIEREAAMANTNRQLRAISATAPMLAEEQAFRAGMAPAVSVLRDMRQGGIGGAIGGMLERGATRLQSGMTERGIQQTNAELAKMLFPNTTPEVLDAMTRLQQRQAQMGRYAKQRALIPGLLADPITEPVVPNR